MARNGKVLAHFINEAKLKKAWAIKKEQEVGRDWPEASDLSRIMLNEFLDYSVKKIAEIHYDYLYSRAHAYSRFSQKFIDPEAKEKWEKLSGLKIQNPE